MVVFHGYQLKSRNVFIIERLVRLHFLDVVYCTKQIHKKLHVNTIELN